MVLLEVGVILLIEEVKIWQDSFRLDEVLQQENSKCNVCAMYCLPLVCLQTNHSVHTTLYFKTSLTVEMSLSKFRLYWLFLASVVNADILSPSCSDLVQIRFLNLFWKMVSDFSKLCFHQEADLVKADWIWTTHFQTLIISMNVCRHFSVIGRIWECQTFLMVLDMGGFKTM